jgi:S-DNA-T family DNA segregation ATPase FtsK/SpoIIIE
MAVKKEITRTGWQEVAGILLLALCVLGILSLFSYDPQDVSALTNPPNAPPANFIGPVGAWFGFLSFILFGVCGYLVPAGLAYVGLLCLFKREGRIWTKALWMLGLLLAITALVDMSPLTWEALREKVNAGSAGGLLGDLLTRRTLVSLLGSVGTAILGIAVLLVSFVMLFEVRPVLLAHQVWDFLLDQYERFETWRKSRLDRQEQLLEEQREVEKRRKRLEEAMKGQDTPPAATVRRVAKTREPAPVVAPEPEPLVVAENEPYRAEDEPETVVPPPVAAAEEPQPELLKKAVDFVKNVRQKQRDKVHSRRPGRVRGRGGSHQRRARPGGHALRVAARAGRPCGAYRRPEQQHRPGDEGGEVRVQAPIPGKGVVGIEVPNPKTTTVYLREDPGERRPG